MFRMHRSFRVKNGQGREGRSYMVAIADHLKRRYGVQCDTYLEIFGPAVGTCHLMMDFADLVTFEAFWSQLGADDEFGAIQGQEADISIEGSVTQALLHSHRATEVK